MTDEIAQRIVLASRPSGPVGLENFRFETRPMPTLPAGGLLLRTLYLSLDPYMRGRMDDDWGVSIRRACSVLEFDRSLRLDDIRKRIEGSRP